MQLMDAVSRLIAALRLMNAPREGLHLSPITFHLSPLTSLPQRRPRPVPLGALFVGVSHTENGGFIERFTKNLQADR
jgi:hypothetical protein